MHGNIEDAQDAQQETGPSLFAGNIPIKAALNELRLRLLDLTGRNRLINFKHSPGKSLQFVHTSLEGTFRRLTGDQAARVTIAPLPEPDKHEWVVRNDRPARPDPKDYATQIGIDPTYELSRGNGKAVVSLSSVAQARTLFFAEDLGKHCRKLEREAKLAIEETGTNMLYLVLGFLEFSEAPGSGKLYQAPLLCVPVAMTRTDESQYSSFHLKFTGDEFADNLSLREKLKRDFGFNLPAYDTENEPSIDAYLDMVADAVACMPNWRVRRMMTLTLLSFTNMLLVRELDPDCWPAVGTSSALLEHPLVKQVFAGRSSSGQANYAQEYLIDDHPKSDLPLIYDADSSQHSALIDVLEGKNRVIEGPPGTGKSQTITNLIAAALQAGKKVLFVAEKLAALEVVKSRLTLAGLAPFVLELHSNKTNKKRVLEDIADRISVKPPKHSELPELLSRQELKRRELRAYADLMNTRAGNHFELTLHQVMWRSERHRLRCGESASAVQSLEFLAASRTNANEFAAICERLRHLAEQLQVIGSYGPEHALWGFFPTEFRPEDDLTVQRTLGEFTKKFNDFFAAANNATMLLGDTNINMNAASAEQLLSVLASLAPFNSGEIDFSLLPALFPSADPRGAESLAILQDIQTGTKKLAEIEANAQRYLLMTQQVNAAVCEKANAILVELTALGVAGFDQTRMGASVTTLQRTVEEARSALAHFKSTADIVSLPFAANQCEVKAIEAVVTVAASASTAWLDYRHEGLRTPGATAKLHETALGLEKIRTQHAKLDGVLYMDMVPPDGELMVAIQTLREGDAWYRILQTGWRKAVGLHKRLEKKKSKILASERLQEIELLFKHKRIRAAWNADENLRSVAGQHFKGEQTPLAQLLECAQWIERSRATLENASLRTADFDVVTAERLVIGRLARQAPVVAQAVAALSHLDNSIRALLHGAPPSILKRIDTDAWTERIATAESAISVMKAAQAFLGEYLKESTPADTGINALKASTQAPALAAHLAEHAAGKALLGSRFQGRQTNLAPMLAAHIYGTQVKKANLPAQIEQLLVSQECVSNYSRLSSCTGGIKEGWLAAADFAAAMARCGRFWLVAWADPTGKSTQEYAQALAYRAKRAADNLGGLLAWAQYVDARRELTALGLEEFVTSLESGRIQPDRFENAFIYRFYAAIAKDVFDKSPALRQFRGTAHSAIRKEFADLDREIIKLRGQQVAADCRSHSKPPAGNNGIKVGDKTETHLLDHLLSLQKPRTPLRQILRRAGHAIQELKPCFMMGPQAVAQFLEPGHLHFDIVIMDEASQLRPEQAIGAIARGSQLVVVGDPKQLPPTSFFARMAAAGTDDDGQGQSATSEAESILDVCISHFQPVRTLRWHYRSKHESLIAFSNQHFYRGNLVVFPSPYPKSKSLGLRYQYVADGIYENQMNHVEARRVVEAAVEHILHRPDDSLGIVTLNVKQRDLVAELLEDRLKTLPEAVNFKERWEAEGAELFIKNLENVQGDERDCIVISTTFGKPPGASVVRQNFGPISRQGGWRRLNVLFTRAKKSVAVFSSMRPEDIVADGKTPDGTKALRNYLEYARNGVLPLERETGLPPDSDFEIAVIDVLRAKGYEVTPQLGVAGFRIDIAVKHPAHHSGYLAAIECDGASYHSGVSVRDRDRIRQEILESLGWRDKIWRIWSTDWFRNPLAETDRLLQFLEVLKAKPVADEYAVHDEPESATKEAALPVPAEKADAKNLVFDQDEEDLEIEIGDLVLFAPADALENVTQVRLTSQQTNADIGLVAENTPLGSILVGATVGETIVLRVPSRAPQPYVIQSIKRAAG